MKPLPAHPERVPSLTQREVGQTPPAPEGGAGDTPVKGRAVTWSPDPLPDVLPHRGHGNLAASAGDPVHHLAHLCRCHPPRLQEP